MRVLIFSLILLTFYSCKDSGGNNNGLCQVSGGTSQQCNNPDPGVTQEFSFVAMDPMEGSSNFNVDSDIVIQFTNSINQSSVIYNSGDRSLDNIILEDSQGNDVLLEVYFENDLLRLRPMFSLTSSERYNLTIKTSITDLESQNLTQEITSHFFTGSDSGSNPGDMVNLTFSDRENQRLNIPVDYYILDYGKESRFDGGENFKYEHNRQIYRSEADMYYNEALDNYSVQVTDILDTGHWYYFSMKACNSEGCSAYTTNEAQKYVE